MDDGIKQRLIGAIVLVALMVIFLPMLFNDVDSESVDILIEMPEKPAVPEFDISKPTKPSEQTVNEVPVSPSEDDDQEALEALKDKKVDANGLPVSWTLQVASFKEHQNAETLRDKLRDGGFKAYIKYRLDVEPRMVRVFVGPVLERDKIEELKLKIRDTYKLEGVVVRYLP